MLLYQCSSKYYDGSFEKETSTSMFQCTIKPIGASKGQSTLHIKTNIRSSMTEKINPTLAKLKAKI